ncbi:neuropeptide Y receptor type 6-like [Mytilus trossulus]|uniref:neuropeptide Y receptor type 6-like n=1 Tax=Mytilus trossulus TaxID=6551 RepID=UPI003004117D
MSSNLTIQDLEEDNFRKDGIGVTIFLSLLCGVGVFGNAHAFLIYTFRFKKTNCRVFVQWLSSVDIVVCVICIPFEISIVVRNMTFKYAIVCKLFRFLTHALVMSSGFMLAVIAIHRKRKLGNPHGRQFTLKRAHIACFVVLIIAGLISVPSVYFYGAVETGTPDVERYQCTVDPKHFMSSYFIIFIVFLAVLLNILYIICIIAYSIVIKIITSQINSRFSTRLQTNVYLPKSNSDQKEKTRDKTEKPNDSLKYSRDISFLFIAASTMSYIGYLLTVISFLIDFINPDTTGSFKSVSAILYRGFFISSAGNPVVYLFLERQFRVECKNVYSKLFGKCCWSKELTIIV